MTVSSHTGWGQVSKLRPGPPHHLIPRSKKDTGSQTAPYLDMHPGPAQQAQCGVSGTVDPQGHLLPQLLQAPLKLGPPAGKGVWRAVPAPPHQAEGWQGRQGLREMVFGTWSCQGQVGTHLRFSSSLCTDLPMPKGDEVRGSWHCPNPQAQAIGWLRVHYRYLCQVSLL